jgi:hypothetical protein
VPGLRSAGAVVHHLAGATPERGFRAAPAPGWAARALPRESQLGKLFLLSIVLAPIVLPLRAARAKNARKGFRKTIIQMALFNVFYLFVLLFIYGRF